MRVRVEVEGAVQSRECRREAEEVGGNPKWYDSGSYLSEASYPGVPR